MADKNQNQYHPAEVNGYHRNDQESLQDAEEARRKKKMKWTIGIIAFVIFQGSPSFNMAFLAPIRVKNTNWGPFKYGASNVTFTYGDVEVGRVNIPKSKANFKSTKKINLNVTVSGTTSNSTLPSVITLKSQGELKGKVTVMFMFKKNKISRMNCTMDIDTSEKVVKSVQCS
ncbi:LEA_2 domain-containing protein [Psidium guajava]|nr:LEA_2 domain-containing protein [Psidium guajava]